MPIYELNKLLAAIEDWCAHRCGLVDLAFQFHWPTQNVEEVLVRAGLCQAMGEPTERANPANVAAAMTFHILEIHQAQINRLRGPARQAQPQTSGQPVTQSQAAPSRGALDGAPHR